MHWRRNYRVCKKLPYNVDLVMWVKTNFRMKSPHSNKINEIWAGLNIGFFYLMRASELRQMGQKDFEVGLEEGKRKLTIYIYQSKTDQSQRGCFRTLVETGDDICPVLSTIAYLNSFDWDCESDDKLLSDDLERRLRSVIKRIASPNGLEPSRFSTHSLRSGGATALYVRGVSLDHIRRFGRWASDTFRRYLYRDNQVFKYVGSAMVTATGFLGQLQMAQNPTRQVAFMEDRDDEGNCFRVGGTISEVRDSDSEECPIARLQTVLQPGCEIED